MSEKFDIESHSCGCGSCRGFTIRRRADGVAFPRVFRSRKQADLATTLLVSGSISWNELELLVNGTSAKEFLAKAMRAAAGG